MQTNRQKAYAEYDAASAHLDIAWIRERASGVISQGEPLGALIQKNRILPDSDAREAICKLIEYIVYDRALPKE